LRQGAARGRLPTLASRACFSLRICALVSCSARCASRSLWCLSTDSVWGWGAVWLRIALTRSANRRVLRDAAKMKTKTEREESARWACSPQGLLGRRLRRRHVGDHDCTQATRSRVKKERWPRCHAALGKCKKGATPATHSLVWLLPPRESCRRRVSFELRKGTWALPRTSASITLPKQERLRLMAAPLEREQQRRRYHGLPR
jgi:hypothetical protein